MMTIFGAVLIGGSLLYSSVALWNVEQRKAMLEQEVTSKTAEIKELATKQGDMQRQIEQSQKTIEEGTRQLAALRQDLAQARCALSSSRSAIEAFHQRNYGHAIALYSEALRCDPHNAYLLNLKAYSEFKDDRLEDAIRSERQSIEADPSYAWGYFDLARFLCASGTAGNSEAKQRIDQAIRLRPDLKSVMQDDGEFKRLCGKLVPAD